jgi:hypothetical protein
MKRLISLSMLTILMAINPAANACPFDVRCSTEYLLDPDNRGSVDLAVAVYGSQWLPDEVRSRYGSFSEEPTRNQRTRREELDAICEAWYRRDQETGSYVMSSAAGWAGGVVGFAVGTLTTRNLVGGGAGAVLGYTLGNIIGAAYNAATPDSCP